MILVCESGYKPAQATYSEDADMQSGIITGLEYKINEYIRTFEKNRTDYKIVLTVGDGDFMMEMINYQIKSQSDVVLDGLNYIIEYNAE